MDLSDDFLEGVNVVEIYYVSGPEEGAWNTDGFSTIPIAHDKPPKFVPREYRRNTQRIVEYNHKNMAYSYDTANDAQRNVVRTTVRDLLIDTFYIRALSEDVIPCHQFPCTTEIHHAAHIERTTYTIHNRLSLIVDFVKDGGQGYYTYMLRYAHAANVDRTKINQVLREALATIKA